MISIKIECGCGQHYAFDVDPVGGRLPSAVTCPVCGADGTAAANAALAEEAAAPSPAPTSSGARLRVATPLPTADPATSTARARRPARPGFAVLPGQPDRAQVQFEARAKISWGDPPEEVIRYLMIQGVGYEEASGLVREMYRERVTTIRANGIRYILGGIVLIGVPIATYLTFLSVGFMFIKLFALTILVGLGGLWMVIKGAGMVLAPRSESGDVAEQ